MNKIDRVLAVLEGRQPDRPPISFWYHFGPDRVAVADAVEDHIHHAETYDLDFLKVMNDQPYPGPQVLQSVGDLKQFSVLRGDEDGFGRQLEVIAALADRFSGERLLTTTVFNAWTAMRRMMTPAEELHGPPTLDEGADPRDALFSRFLAEAPEAMTRALDVVARSLANFARQCLDAGANGIYLSVRDDWVDTLQNGPGTYDRLVAPGDRMILDRVDHGMLNIVHVCGRAVDFRRFANYPAHAISWADRSAGPSIAEVIGWVRPVPCAGLDNLGTLLHGSPEDCEAEVDDALRQASRRPILLAPGCTFDPVRVSAANLRAVRQAVERVRV